MNSTHQYVIIFGLYQIFSFDYAHTHSVRKMLTLRDICRHLTEFYTYLKEYLLLAKETIMTLG